MRGHAPSPVDNGPKENRKSRSRRGFAAHAFALKIHTFDDAITPSDVEDGGAEVREMNKDDEVVAAMKAPGGWVKTMKCLGCNCQEPDSSRIEKVEASENDASEDEDEDETSDDGRSLGDDSDYDEYDTRVNSHYLRTVKRYREHVERMEALSKGSVRVRRRRPRLVRMKRELKEAALRGRRSRVERKVAEAIKEREALAAATRAKEEALVSFGPVRQDLITPTAHLSKGPDMGGNMLREMRKARLDYEHRVAWATTSMSLEPARRVLEDKFNIKSGRVPTIKEYIKEQQRVERGEDATEEVKPARAYNPVTYTSTSRVDVEWIIDNPYAYTSTSRMDVDWIRRQRMADVDWIREYVEWALDTGSTHIVTNDKRLVVDARPTRMTITGVMSSGDRLQAEGGIEGSATDMNGRKVNLKLGQTLLHDKANMNLLGANELLKKGNIIHLETDNCYMIVRSPGGGKAKIPIEERDGLFIMRLEHLVPRSKIISAMAQGEIDKDVFEEEGAFAGMAEFASLDTWHKRLNHIPKKQIKIMFDRGTFEGMDIKGIGRGCDAKCTCETCRIARAAKQPTYKKRRFEPKLGGAPFRSCQSDLKGPLQRGLGDYRYTMPFICEESRYAITYYLRKKSEAAKAYQQFLEDLRRLGYSPPARIRTDGAKELIGQAFEAVNKKYGIEHTITPPHKSHLNGIVERYHRTIHEAANALLYEAKLNSIMWPYAVAHAEYIKNRMMHSVHGTRITPYEIVTHRRARADRIRVFGCDMYAYNHSDETKAKAGRAKAEKLIYVGVPPDSDSGYLGFDPETRTVRVVYDVTFDESMANRANNLRTFDGTEDFQITAEGRAFKKQASQLKDDLTRATFQDNPDRPHLNKSGAADEEESDQEELWEDQEEEDSSAKQTEKSNDWDMSKWGDWEVLTDHQEESTTKEDKGKESNNKEEKQKKKKIGSKHDDWATRLPKVEPIPDDPLIGKYVQAPFKSGWYFGIVTEKYEEPDHDDRLIYKVVYEDEDTEDLNEEIISKILTEPDQARRKGRPSAKERDSIRGPASVDRIGKELEITKSAAGSRRSARSTKRVDYGAQMSAVANQGQAGHPRDWYGPLAPECLEDYYRRELLEVSDGYIRPHRLEPVGTKVMLSKEDKKFLKNAFKENLPITYLVDNPKRGESFKRYANYSLAKTLRESKSLSVAYKSAGLSKEEARLLAERDIEWDYSHGYIFFPGNESLLDGHFVNAKTMAQDHKVNCRSEMITCFASKGVRRAISLGTATSLQEMLMEDKRMMDALKYMENPTALNALMEAELKKLLYYDPSTNTYHIEPKSEKEAHDGPDKARWRKAEEKEVAALDEFGSYELVTDIPQTDSKGHRIKLMGSKFVYKLKTGDDGNVTRWKARLVCRGFMSREGIDHEADECYAPVMSYDTFRLILSIAAGNGWAVQQVDIANAYLQGHLVDKEGKPKPLYMKDPLGRKDKEGRPYYMKLLRPLYGLRQSAYRWNEALTEHLIGYGFKRAESDSCMFTISKKRSEIDPSYTGDEVDKLIIGLYVDDLTFTGSSAAILDWFNKVLEARFKINPHDRGEISYMLGTRVRQDLQKGTITMDQTAAIEALAKRFKIDSTMPNARNCTPIAVEALPKQAKKDVEFEYLSAVGSLLHISGMTRPDIAYAVGSVARHGATYGAVHVKAVKRIIAYLYHTRYYGITYRHKKSLSHHDPLRQVQNLVMYQAGRPPIMNPEGEARMREDPLRIFCDADFGGDTTMRSTTGIVTFLNCGPISWSSKLQKLQALSTTESEVYAATEAIKDAALLKVYLEDLELRDDVPIPIHEDNSACIKMGMQHLKRFNRARHYVQRVNFLQERVWDRTAKLVSTPTEEEVADVLTKPLSFPLFSKFRDVLVSNVYPEHQPGTHTEEEER